MAHLPVGARRLTRRSFAVGTWSSSGRYVNGAATDTTFWGSYQAVSTNLQREPGGERRKATHVLSSTVALQVTLPNGGPIADRVIVPSGPDAGTFEVATVQPADAWSPIPHYEADIYRLNEVDPGDPNLATTVAEIILQTVRTLAKSANNLTDAQVVVQQASPMPRPPLPYLAVLVDTMDEQRQVVDSPHGTYADAITVTGGTTGSTYQIDAAGETVVYTRLLADTNTTVATALASLLTATGTIQSTAIGAILTLVAYRGTLATATSGTGTMSLTARYAPATVMTGLRNGTISLWGYGELSRPWLETLRSYLASPDAIPVLVDGGVTILPTGDTVVETVDLGTGYEDRYSSPLQISYTLQTVAQLAIYAEKVLVAGSASSSGGSGLPFTVSVEP